MMGDSFESVLPCIKVEQEISEIVQPGIKAEIIDDDEDEHSQEEMPKKRQRGKGKIWLFCEKFDTMEEALDYISCQGIWSKVQTTSTAVGIKVFYRCNQVKKSAGKCPASVYLLYHDHTDAVSLFCTESQHVHDDVAKTRGICSDVKAIIKQLYENDITKPKQIAATLRHLGLPEPAVSQLNNFLRIYKKEKFGNSSVGASTTRKKESVETTAAGCNCDVFLKEYICEHILDLFNARDKVSEVAKTMSNGEKRKRGRPRKITSATTK